MLIFRTIQYKLRTISPYFLERCGRLTEISKFVRPEPVRSVSLGFSRDGSRNPLLSHSGGHVTVVSESSQESEKSGLPPRPMRRLVRSKRIYEEHLTKEDDGADQGRNFFQYF
jgi:hypothetical protein